MRRLRGSACGLGLVLVLGGCTGDSTPAPPSGPPTAPVSVAPPVPADPLPLEQLAAFSGVASLNAGSNCTGTLIDTGVPSGPAYVLTNGHCAGDVGRSPQGTTLSEEWGGTAQFLAAEGNLDDTLTVDVVGLEYSTMRHTDTAILRLKPTLGELEELGIQPVPITTTEPAPGTAVVNVAVPVQELAIEDWVLRRGECTVGAQHTLIEHLWMWFGAWSNDCPGIIQGSSGSPLFTLDADGAPQEVVAMINTTTTGATAANGGACSINLPCEVTDEGVRMVEQTSYAQSVAGVGACFAADGQFTLGEGCPLPRSGVWAESGGGSFRGGDAPDAAGRTPEVSLVGRTPGTVRTALVPLGDGTACQQAQTYQGIDPVALPKAGEVWDLVGVTIPVDLPEEEGHYALCAASATDYPGAATILFDVDRTPPLFPASAEVEDLGDGDMLVRPHLNPPDTSTVRFTWGDPATVDCTDTDTFQDFFIVPLTIPREDLPATYCVYGLDAAGNASTVTTLDIPAP